MNYHASSRLVFVLSLFILCTSTFLRADDAAPAAAPPEVAVTHIPTANGEQQPIRYFVPEEEQSGPVPLLVFLHSWSGDYSQPNLEWVVEAKARGWAAVLPNFQGPNFKPTACGSELAQQEILDAVDHMVEQSQIDSSRIYLAGASGGGHMSLLMAAKHPERFTAVSAWVGITDLFEWHAFHSRGEQPGKYAVNIEVSCGGKPGESKAIDAEYRSRSAIFFLDQAGDLPIDIGAGIHDGHTGSVPVSHSLKAFNVIASAMDKPTVSDEVIDHIVETEKVPEGVAALDEESAVEEDYPREIQLRRTAGSSRVTIFEGGHEGLPSAAVAWLAKHSRETKTPEK
ncbi:MAG: prolyl oligopeptidase [Planctomyces sp.]|nr:prolyl oligopeptidase [Planctomyces sp.]